mgnify:FL=1
MIIIRTNKFRLYPNAIQKAMLHEMFNISRFSYNYTLGKIKDGYFGSYQVQNGKNKGKIVSKIPNRGKISGFITMVKVDNEFASKLPNDFIQGSLTNLYKGFESFFKGNTKYPNFKKKKKSKNLFLCMQVQELK